MTNALLIRLPNWLGDVVMALPVVRAILTKFPQSTLLGQAAFAPLLADLGIAAPYHTLPAKTLGYYGHFLRLRGQYQQAVLFANSQRSDLETFLAGIPLRYGITWRERPRCLLNRRYPIRHPEQDGNRHQTQLWADFTAHFNLQGGLSFAPLSSNLPHKAQILLICGSENSPEKRWPSDHWRALIGKLLAETPDDIILSGTQKDRLLTNLIADGFPGTRVKNIAGETDIRAYLRLLRESRLVIGNDTGGLHLANALGTAVIGLYGPTNPQRTRPIFAGKVVILQPPGSPPNGGTDIAGLTVEETATAALRLLTA